MGLHVNWDYIAHVLSMHRTVGKHLGTKGQVPDRFWTVEQLSNLQQL
jgi:hypothetical protein